MRSGDGVAPMGLVFVIAWMRGGVAFKRGLAVDSYFARTPLDPHIAIIDRGIDMLLWT